ncbi:NAD(+) diphosphatase [Blastochloris viridis]|nr:NAD(+) diphosphatase [Blastochloris viridis]BAR99302.1 NADH pyrophosphatase [Blastochloris viridis]
MLRPSFRRAPPPPLGYVGGTIDRASEHRTDDAFLAGAALDPAARSYVVAGEMIVLHRVDAGYDALFDLDRAAGIGVARERAFLGLEGRAPRFATLIDAVTTETQATYPDVFVSDLRSIAMQGLVPPGQLAGLATAKALMHWHATHRFCSACGTPTRLGLAGWKRDCPSCQAEHFPRTDPVVIMLVTRGERCLLCRQARFPPGMWSCLAGFVEPGETFEDAVRRETREEAGVAVGRVRYLASQPWPFPMSVMVGCIAEGLSELLTVDTSELLGARWVARRDAALMLSRSHPDQSFCPPPTALAHHLIRAFVEGRRL